MFSQSTVELPHQRGAGPRAASLQGLLTAALLHNWAIPQSSCLHWIKFLSSPHPKLGVEMTPTSGWQTHLPIRHCCTPVLQLCTCRLSSLKFLLLAAETILAKTHWKQVLSWIIIINFLICSIFWECHDVDLIMATGTWASPSVLLDLLPEGTGSNYSIVASQKTTPRWFDEKE